VVEIQEGLATWFATTLEATDNVPLVGLQRGVGEFVQHRGHVVPQAGGSRCHPSVLRRFVVFDQDLDGDWLAAGAVLREGIDGVGHDVLLG
jgi:hypothetical protein